MLQKPYLHKHTNRHSKSVRAIEKEREREWVRERERERET